jgi:MOSC domain-containing protein YiiM
VPACAIVVSGLVGDGHDHEKHNHPDHAVCLLDVEAIERFVAEGFPLVPGAVGENLTLRGVDVQSLSPGDRLRFAGGVELEITKARKPCFVLDAIDPALKVAAVGRIGVLARVIAGGMVEVGERVDVDRAVVAT